MALGCTFCSAALPSFKTSNTRGLSALAFALVVLKYMLGIRYSFMHDELCDHGSQQVPPLCGIP